MKAELAQLREGRAQPTKKRHSTAPSAALGAAPIQGDSGQSSPALDAQQFSFGGPSHVYGHPPAGLGAPCAPLGASSIGVGGGFGYPGQLEMYQQMHAMYSAMQQGG